MSQTPKQLYMTIAKNVPAYASEIEIPADADMSREGLIALARQFGDDEEMEPDWGQAESLRIVNVVDGDTGRVLVEGVAIQPVPYEVGMCFRDFVRGSMTFDEFVSLAARQKVISAEDLHSARVIGAKLAAYGDLVSAIESIAAAAGANNGDSLANAITDAVAAVRDSLAPAGPLPGTGSSGLATIATTTLAAEDRKALQDAEAALAWAIDRAQTWQPEWKYEERDNPGAMDRFCADLADAQDAHADLQGTLRRTNPGAAVAAETKGAASSAMALCGERGVRIEQSQDRETSGRWDWITADGKAASECSFDTAEDAARDAVARLGLDQSESAGAAPLM